MVIKTKTVPRPTPENFDALISDTSISDAIRAEIPNIIEGAVNAKAKYDEGWVKGFAEESMEQLDTEVTTDVIDSYRIPEDDAEDNPYISEQDYIDSKKFASNLKQGKWTQRQYDMAQNSLIRQAAAARPGVDLALIINEFNKHASISSVPHLLDVAEAADAAAQAMNDEIRKDGTDLGIPLYLWKTDPKEYMRQYVIASDLRNGAMENARTIELATTTNNLALLNDKFKQNFSTKTLPYIYRRAGNNIDLLLERNGIKGGLDGLVNLGAQDQERLPAIRNTVIEWRAADRANLLNIISIEGYEIDPTDDVPDTGYGLEYGYEEHAAWVEEQLVDYDKFTQVLVDAINIKSLKELQDTYIAMRQNDVVLQSNDALILAAMNDQFGNLFGDTPLGRQLQRQMGDTVVRLFGELFGGLVDGTNSLQNPPSNSTTGTTGENQNQTVSDNTSLLGRRVDTRIYDLSGTLVSGTNGENPLVTGRAKGSVGNPKDSSQLGPEFDIHEHIGKLTSIKDGSVIEQLSTNLTQGFEVVLNKYGVDGEISDIEVAGLITWVNAWAITHQNKMQTAQMGRFNREPTSVVGQDGKRYYAHRPDRIASRAEAQAFVNLVKNPHWTKLRADPKLANVLYNNIGVDVGTAIATEWAYVAQNEVPELDILLSSTMSGLSVRNPRAGVKPGSQIFLEGTLTPRTEKDPYGWYKVPEVVDTRTEQPVLFGGREGVVDLAGIMSLFPGIWDPRKEIRIKDIVKLDFDDKGNISFVAQSPEELGYEVTGGSRQYDWEKGMTSKLLQGTSPGYSQEEGQKALDWLVEQLNSQYSATLTGLVIAKSNVESTAIPGRDWYSPKHAARELVQFTNRVLWQKDYGSN